MYSVLIVDDEEPVLESYSYLIDSSLDEFEVGGTARSGSEAIKIARENKPDVVIMDIAMPGIDGLDTLSELQRDFPEIICILSTAYERFDLAQRAIPLQVFAYLVKPVSRKRFTETMFRVKEKLNERAIQASRRLETVERGEETITRETQRFILSIPWRKFDDVYWSQIQHLFQLHSDYGVIVLVEGEEYRTFVDLLERRYRCLSGEHLHRLVILVSGIHESQHEQLRTYIDKKVLPHIDPAVHMNVGIGTVRRYDELYRSYDEALAEIPSTRERTEDIVQFETLAQQLVDATERAHIAGDLDQLYRSVSDFAFDHWSFPVAINRIALVIQRLLLDFGRRIQDPRIALEVADPAQEVIDFRSTEDINAWAQRVLRRIVEIRSRFGPSQWPAIVRHAVAYIDRHFAEPLQLATVAEECGVSSGHLSRLFSEHLSMSLIDYLNTVRITAAQSLLHSPHPSVKEVAYSVGFHDPNYFGRVFKRQTGVTPSEYSQEVIDERS